MFKNDTPRRILLIDVDRDGCEQLAARLRAQDFAVDTAYEGAVGAEMALTSPPAIVIADLWMPGVSGVQLCRLLRAEPATADAAFILRAEHDDPKNRFWAERAGAEALVSKGRMGELVRLLKRLAATPVSGGSFFTHLGAGPHHIRDRIAEHLDSALFESVIAAEVRALATASSLQWLFDCLSQLTAQLITYHWMAVSTGESPRIGIHGHPASIAECEARARLAFGASSDAQTYHVADKDAAELPDACVPPVVVRDVPFGDSTIGRIAVAPTVQSRETEELVELLARELGGAIKIATLIEDTQRLATTDSLTGLMNRRAFIERLDQAMAQTARLGEPIAVVLLDVDHFKQINDQRGHATGDRVLAALGRLLASTLRPMDVTARWGGEEFVVSLPGTCEEEARSLAEHLRATIAACSVVAGDASTVSFTASIGVAVRSAGENVDALVDRADRAVYAAKIAGRNRVELATQSITDTPSRAA